jgi:NarL family two-component system sensor histidine kinase LiaS
LKVRDDGKGFNLEEAEAKGGLGLVSMRERVDQLGGKLEIFTRSREGTEIQVTIPLISGIHGQEGQEE